jgi:hypothetical protein
VLPLPPAVLLLLLLPLALLWYVLPAAWPLPQLQQVITSRCHQPPLLLLLHGEPGLPAVPWLAPPPGKQIDIEEINMLGQLTVCMRHIGNPWAGICAMGCRCSLPRISST